MSSQFVISQNEGISNQQTVICTAQSDLDIYHVMCLRRCNSTTYDM